MITLTWADRVSPVSHGFLLPTADSARRARESGALDGDAADLVLARAREI